jgi:hypothetical protein
MSLYPQGTNKMNGLKITKIMKDQRAEFRFPDILRNGQPVFAVGVKC